MGHLAQGVVTHMKSGNDNTFLLNVIRFQKVAKPHTVETTGFHRAGHAVETRDADREAPTLLSEDIP